MFERIATAFNRPKFLQTPIDEFIVGATGVLVLIVLLAVGLMIAFWACRRRP